MRSSGMTLIDSVTRISACQLIQVPNELGSIHRVWNTPSRWITPKAVGVAKRLIFWTCKGPPIMLIKLRPCLLPCWMDNANIDYMLQALLIQDIHSCNAYKSGGAPYTRKKNRNLTCCGLGLTCRR